MIFPYENDSGAWLFFIIVIGLCIFFYFANKIWRWLTKEKRQQLADEEIERDLKQIQTLCVEKGWSYEEAKDYYLDCFQENRVRKASEANDVKVMTSNYVYFIDNYSEEKRKEKLAAEEEGRKF